MTQHFTRNTVSASLWCAKCQKPTQHRIDGVKKGPCLECIARLEVEHDLRTPLAPIPTGRQGELFDV